MALPGSGVASSITGDPGIAAHLIDARDEALLADCYGEIRRIALRVLRSDDAHLSIQPTDLAHEAVLRLMALNQMVWQDRTHFLAMAARVMRQALIDEVRRFRAAKRSAPDVMTEWTNDSPHRRIPLDLFDDVLERLFALDSDRARVVELRFYAGLTMSEIAIAMNSSVSTTERRWRTARAWILTALDGDD